MGVIHKLNPEVLKFIIESKQENPSLSCRTLTQLVFDKLQIKISKSSINAIFKENNLSMPIGRRQKHKKPKFNMPVLPVIEGNRAITVVTPEKKAESPEINPEEKRIKEAEEWARKLQEEEKTKVEEKLKLERQEIEDAKNQAEGAELKSLMEEAARVNIQKNAEKAEKEQKAEEQARQVEEEKAAQEAALKAEQERLTRLAEEENKRVEEEAKRIEADRVAQEEARKAEEERLVKLAEESKKAQEEAERIRIEKAAQDEDRKSEEEKSAQEAALRAEKEKWARLAEEELRVKQQGVKKEDVLQKEEPVGTAALSQGEVCSGLILLKALDCLIGGSKAINEVISKELGVEPTSFLSLTEALIFRSLFGNNNIAALWNIIGKQYSQEKLESYYTQINQIQNLKLNIPKIILSAFTEVRGIIMHFNDGGSINFDGRFYSSWTTQNIPYDFSSPLSELREGINKYFFQGQHLILFSAPGYDIPSKDFFNLLLNIGSSVKCPDALILFCNKLEEIERVSLNRTNRYTLIFGIWPWQFTSSRKVKRIGEFDFKHIEGINKDLYLAEVEIELLRASLNQSITLKGCAIKTNPSEKIRLVVLNNDEHPMSLERLAGVYLNCWPNFEEAFHDFSRKIELFTYTSNIQKFFSKDKFEAAMAEPETELEKIFAKYITMLDAYLRWHFLPAGYSEKDFSYTNKCFYKLPVKFAVSQNIISVKIQADQEDQVLKDLEYLTRRLNERQINLTDDLRLYFENAFK